MDVESAIVTFISSSPNLAVALLVLWWTTKRIDALLDHQSTLINQLVEMMRENRKMLMVNGHDKKANQDPNSVN